MKFYTYNYYKGDRFKMYYNFRSDSVPGIHKRRRWFKIYYHCHIDCMNEKRRWTEDFKLIKEYHIKFRIKRSISNLPDTWDDIPKGRTTKGWKRSRKQKQWM